MKTIASIVLALALFSCHEEKDCSQLKVQWDNAEKAKDILTDNHPDYNAPASVQQEYSLQLQKVSQLAAKAQTEYKLCTIQ